LSTRTLVFGILISSSFFSVIMGTLIGFTLIAVCAALVIMTKRVRRHRKQRKALEELQATAAYKAKDIDAENPLDATAPYMVQQQLPGYHPMVQEYFLMPAPPVIPQENN